MNFLQRTPFFRLLLPLIVGIVIFHYFQLANLVLYLLVTFSVFIIFTAYILRKVDVRFKYRWLWGSGFFVFIAVFSYFLSMQKDKENIFTNLDNKKVFLVELTKAPIEKSKTFRCDVKLLKCFDNNTWIPIQGNAVVYIQKEVAKSALFFGDQLVVLAEFKKPIGAVNPSSFDYAAYLKRHGIGATCYLAKDTWYKIHTHKSFSIRRIADFSRNKLLKIYRKFNIQGNEFAVLAALTLGFTDVLEPDLRTSYSATGAMHILSVSGLHVGIVYFVIAFLLRFLSKTTRQKIVRAILIFIFLWIYAFITGMSPSVVRSTIMFSFVAIGAAFDRKSQIYNTVFMSAFFMLLINPTLLFDIGFQLSYAAVLSIVFFQHPFTIILPTNNKYLRFLRDLLTVSLAAQLGTLPFTLYYFHQFPNYFLLTNIIAIPLSTIVIYLAMALLALSFIPYLSVAIAFLLKYSLWLLNILIIWIENLPHSVSILPFDFRQMSFLLLAIICFSTFYYNKKYLALFFGLTAIFLILVISLHQKYDSLNTNQLIVYSGQKSTHVNFIRSTNNYIYTNDSSEMDKIAGSYWKNLQLKKPIILHKNSWFCDGFATFNGKRILILQKELVDKMTMHSPIDIDYLIIGNQLKPRINQVLNIIKPKKIIIDNSISDWYTEKIRKICTERNIKFYSVAEQGAYILNFTH